ncbi:HEAT repeat domain-containing protein [Halopiger djelfimassiliensis]|uniref:HEAT repeat domain-containing protein n=1 Tax=Halopiger djelfimassiliensis TaxID=1293047 RepID=UPI000677BFCE|nr:HEAT repeat domain-containing protein [Halopiger djelfimassiliensis]
MNRDGDGAEALEQPRESAALELPSVLARLDDRDPTAQREAVRTIRNAIDDDPSVCMPTVPKLRSLLERPAIDVHDEVAYCLAELAAQSPADVAPSTDEIVSFVAEHETHAATPELFRCLAAIATERPGVLREHVETIADVLDERDGYDRWGIEALTILSRVTPGAIEPAAPVLADALAANPEANGVTVLAALGRLARSDASLPSLAFVDRTVSLVDHDDDSLRNAAIACLGDVASQAPSAVVPACPRLATALENEEPNTRATAAVTLARIADGADSSAAAVDPAREQLLELLEDDHAHVRANACLALGHGTVGSARERLATLANEDPDPNVRTRAAWAVDRLS